MNGGVEDINEDFRSRERLILFIYSKSPNRDKKINRKVERWDDEMMR